MMPRPPLARARSLRPQVSDESYELGAAALGETGLVELVGLVGYHVYAAITLNAFEVLDPGFDGENVAAPWEADARREEATDPASAGLSTNWLTDYAEI